MKYNENNSDFFKISKVEDFIYSQEVVNEDGMRAIRMVKQSQNDIIPLNKGKKE